MARARKYLGLICLTTEPDITIFKFQVYHSSLSSYAQLAIRPHVQQKPDTDGSVSSGKTVASSVVHNDGCGFLPVLRYV